MPLRRIDPTCLRVDWRDRLKGFVTLLIVLAVAGCGATPTSGRASAAAPVASGADDSLVDIGAGLRGMPDLAATVYVSGITNAAAFAFDASGRLWVATAAYSDAGSDGVYVVRHARATPVEVVT